MKLNKLFLNDSNNHVIFEADDFVTFFNKYGFFPNEKALKKYRESEMSKRLNVIKEGGTYGK